MQTDEVFDSRIREQQSKSALCAQRHASFSLQAMDPLLNELDIDSLVPLGADDAFLPLDDADAKLLDCHDDFFLPDFDIGVTDASQPSPESDATQLRVVGESPNARQADRPQMSNATPATSESWNDKQAADLGHDGQFDQHDHRYDHQFDHRYDHQNQHGHHGQYSNHSNLSSQGGSGLTPPGSSEEEEKRQLRMKKNRENAHLSRVRKKQQLENLEAACRSLANQNAELNVFVQRLAAENFLLRDHLKEVCARAKVAVPDVPSVLEEVPRGNDVEDGGHGGDVGNTPWVEAAADAGPGSSTGGSRGFSSRATRKTTKRKRGGVSSGATAAFLALFSLFLFASPSTFIGDGGAGSQPGAAVAGLPDVSSVATGIIRSGRELLSSEEDHGSNEILSVSDYFSQTVEALLVDQADLDLPKLALSVVEDMAQSALALDGDKKAVNDEAHGNVKIAKDKRDSGHLLPASTVFPALADRFFASSGLESPQMCRKIFEFSASDVPAASPSSKKNIENYVLGTAVGFKGRASGLKIEDKALAPLDTTLSQNDREDSHEAEQADVDEKLDDGNLPVPVQEPSLVSVLLPANASTNPSGPGITAIDELYVVILNPQNTFSTYACQMPNKRALVV